MKPPADAFGPRASILTIGVCEQLPGDTLYLTGWVFNGRNDPRVVDRGCPFMHDEEMRHVGYLGWTFEELKAMSDAQMELSMLETADPRAF